MKQNICQSCSMPLVKKEDFGTKVDGTPCNEYCCYCYQKGAFTAPKMTLQEMIKHVASFHKKMNMTEAEAKKLAEEVLPNLKRWKKDMAPHGCCRCSSKH